MFIPSPNDSFDRLIIINAIIVDAVSVLYSLLFLRILTLGHCFGFVDISPRDNELVPVIKDNYL